MTEQPIGGSLGTAVGIWGNMGGEGPLGLGYPGHNFELDLEMNWQTIVTVLDKMKYVSINNNQAATF